MFILSRLGDGNLKLIQSINTFTTESDKLISTNSEGKLDPSLFSPSTKTGRYTDSTYRESNTDVFLSVGDNNIQIIKPTKRGITLFTPQSILCPDRIYTIYNDGDYNIDIEESEKNNFIYSLPPNESIIIHSMNGKWRIISGKRIFDYIIDCGLFSSNEDYNITIDLNYVN